MAEDLTTYLAEHDVRVRYLHSDIDTVERVEIIRDLRIGEFDVLVGINLLREGLDMPEVSLVAILDADKEGFLRSDRSLIQTIGRAARNLHGKAILYADKITGSMERAIAETNRRRAIQVAYNIKHGITPKTIAKSILDIMEGSHIGLKYNRKRGKQEEAAEIDYTHFSPKELSKKLNELETKMYEHAKNLEFEQAAQVRNQLQKLREHIIDV